MANPSSNLKIHSETHNKIYTFRWRCSNRPNVFWLYFDAENVLAIGVRFHRETLTVSHFFIEELELE